MCTWTVGAREGELLHIIKCDALSCQQCALGEQCGSGVVSKQTACINVAVSLNKACIGRLVYLLICGFMYPFSHKAGLQRYSY